MQYTDAIIQNCSEKSCRLRLDNLCNYIILKGEKIHTQKKICDCILFWIEKDLIIIGLIELKSRITHVNDAVKKLENGTIAALSILEECKNRMKYKIFHIIMSKKIDSPEISMIRTRKIIFEGKKYDIIYKRCGASFYDIFIRLN